MVSPLTHTEGLPSSVRNEEGKREGDDVDDKTGTNLYVLDGGIARTHGTIIPGYRE